MVVPVIAGDIHFDHITFEDGLSNNATTRLLQDRRGFIWVGTRSGLNRYDGYRFIRYRYDPEDPHGISGNQITSLYEDAEGDIWVGIWSGGVSRYHKDTGRFSRLTYDPDRPEASIDARVWQALGDDRGNIWIATEGSGLYRYRPQSGELDNWQESDDPESLPSNLLRCLYVDKRGTLWVGTTDAGLARMDRESGRFLRYRPEAGRSNSISGVEVTDFAEDADGRFWVSTSDGLNLMDRDTGLFRRFQHEPDRADGLPSNRIYALLADNKHRLWVGTTDSGVVMLNLEEPNRGFVNYRHNSLDPRSLRDNLVWDIMQDKTGALWFATTNGLSRYEPARHRFLTTSPVPGMDGTLTPSPVWAMARDDDGVLWAGTLGAGLNRQDPGSNTFHHYRHDPNDPGSLSSDRITTLFIDNPQSIWIGCEGGLNRLQRNPDRITRFRHDPADPASLPNDYIYSTVRDGNDTLWVGTLHGLARLDEKTGKFMNYFHNREQAASLPDNRIRSSYCDRSGNLWIGTMGGGICRYDPLSDSFLNFKDPERPDAGPVYISTISQDTRDRMWLGSDRGLYRFSVQEKRFFPCRDTPMLTGYIMAVLEDRQGRLWVSSTEGLAVWDPETGETRSYNAHDGLQGNQFGQGALSLENRSLLYFGGVNGFDRFYPEKLRDSSFEPQVVITRLLLENKPVKPRPDHADGLLTKPMEDTRRLSFNHKQRMFSFEFSALDPAIPQKNRYAYKMDGFNDHWIETDAQNRRATFTSLPPGNYTFMVRGTNRDGIWSPHEARVAVTILPPWWWSLWTKTLYCLILLGFILRYLHKQRNKLEQQRRDAQQQRAIAAQQRKIAEQQRQMVEQAQEVNERLRQVDRLKDEFLANTSHELRTPLNGIVGLTESLLDGVAGPLNEAQAANLNMVVAGGRRLTSLVNDILDFAKLKNSGLTLSVKPIDLHALAEVVITLSQPLVKCKSLVLVNGVARDLPAAEADENRLLQILHNLVGNAVKFTSYGSVRIQAQLVGKEEKRRLALSVRDTGVGIPKEKQDAIFNSFEQLNGRMERNEGGTGLGLAITRELVELHGGSISLESVEGKGSTFTFDLAVSDKPATTEPGVTRLASVVPVPAKKPKKVPSVGLPMPVTAGNEAFRILVVDDEPVNRRVLFNYLLGHYRVTEAADGPEALRLLEKERFDLVLLDVMMPGLSGYQVCRDLRRQHSVNDLPIIFLTARNQVTDLVNAFDAGGNDFLTKPVIKKELLSRVDTHLRLLDANRHLEKKVAERTNDLHMTNKMLDARNRELESLERIVNAINSNLAPEGVFDNLLSRGHELFPHAQRGLLWLSDNGTEYRPAASIGYRMEAVKQLRLSPKELRGRYLEAGENWGEGIHLITEIMSLPASERLERPFPKALLAMSMRFREELMGVLVWDGDDPFDQGDIRKLRRFRRHAEAAVAKARFTRALERSNQEVKAKNEELIKTQNQLVMSEKMATLGTLAAGVAHEVNNPNNFIYGSAQVLKRELTRYRTLLEGLIDENADRETAAALVSPLSRMNEEIKTIKEGCERISGLVQDMRHFSRMDEADWKHVDLVEGLRATINLTRSNFADIDLSLEAEEPVELECNPAEMNQVYLNLIVNACQAVTERHEQEPDAPREVHIEARRTEQEAVFTFADTGCGIPPEQLDHIWEAFYTTKPVGTGTGLGLYSAWRIIERHQGRFEVDSEEGKGSRFTLRLPLKCRSGGVLR
ncbi:MAG: two-component regulator propeller domain-containing protein [Acidobacteriota bacterium]|nr:two-component regulator propeller domain-containing protein [Acidobacteriota bacterium]